MRAQILSFVCLDLACCCGNCMPQRVGPNTHTHTHTHTHITSQDKRKSIEQTEQTVGLDDRLAGEDGEEAVQSEDKASGGAEGEGAARRVSRSERDNRERPGGMQRWGDGERERRRKARQEEAKREQRAEQDFMSDVSPTGGSGTRRSEKQGHFERQAWQVLPASPLDMPSRSVTFLATSFFRCTT